MSLYTKNQGIMKRITRDDEVKLQDDESQPDTPSFSAVEYIYGDEYEDLMAIAEMKVLSNVDEHKEQEAVERKDMGKKKKGFVFSFKQDNVDEPESQTEEQIIDVSQDENEKIADQTSKVEKSLRLLNIEEKPEPALQPSKEPLKELPKEAKALAESSISSEDSLSQMTNTTLNGSRGGEIIKNTQEPSQNHSFSSFNLFDNFSRKELNQQMAWKEEVFKIDEDNKRSRIRPLRYWIGESIKYTKANLVVVKYRKKIVQTFVHEDDCQLIKASNTKILSNTLVKGEITVPAKTTVRLNWFWMARMSISKDFSLLVSDDKLSIINERGKSSLVLVNSHLTELENTLDVDCTLYLKIYCELS